MARQWKCLVVAASAVLVSSLLCGCSVLGEGEPDPTLNVNQAVKRVDSVLDDTLKAVRPRMKWRDGPAHMSERRNSFTNTSNGEVSVYRTRYVRTKISKVKLAELMSVVYEKWRKAGFKVGEAPQGPRFSGTAPDGCSIRFEVNGFGSVEFLASVGAVSSGPSGDIEGEEGDKFPKAPDGGPDYTPDVRDSYWST